MDEVAEPDRAVTERVVVELTSKALPAADEANAGGTDDVPFVRQRSTLDRYARAHQALDQTVIELLLQQHVVGARLLGCAVEGRCFVTCERDQEEVRVVAPQAAGMAAEVVAVIAAAVAVMAAAVAAASAEAAAVVAAVAVTAGK